MKNITTREPNYKQIYFPYSAVSSACQGSGLAFTRTVSIFRTLTYMQTRFRHQNKPFYSYRNEINTVNQLQLNKSTIVNLLILRFMKSLCFIIIKLNTLTDVPYQWRWVGHLFTYVKTCERSRVKDFEQRSRVYNAVCYNIGFPRGPRRPRYNGVAVYKLIK